jgi:hypothetical protein
MDYELWGKFFLAGAKFKYTDVPFGMHRRHADQKSNDLSRSTEALKPITKRFLERANSLSKEEKDMIREELTLILPPIRNTVARIGTLGALGLPKPVVTEFGRADELWRRRLGI